MEAPLQIVNVEDGTFHLNSDNLQSIISKVPAGVKVAVVSIIGAHRTGKSFLLNLFLRYLRSKQSRLHSPIIGDEDSDEENSSSSSSSSSSSAWMTQEGDTICEGNTNKVRGAGPVKRDSVSEGWGVTYVMDAIVDVDDDAAAAEIDSKNNRSSSYGSDIGDGGATFADNGDISSSPSKQSISSSDSSSNSSNSSNSNNNKPFSDNPTKGYQWGGGNEPQTTGIWMWSEPFLRRSYSGEDIAVLIMDTQGMFDSETPISITAQIFGLSTLVSSFQVYNVEKRIGDDNFQHLALFSEYGRMALNYKENDERKMDGDWMQMDGEPPNSNSRRRTVSDVQQQQNFQRLQFLIRDYQNFDDEIFDLFETQSETDRVKTMRRMEGEMNSYFNSIFPEVCDFRGGGSKKRSSDAADVVYTRDQIRRSYKQIDCFMLPYPGSAMTKPNYDGSVSKIDKAFLIMVNRYIRRLFDEELEPKIVNNQYIHGPELKLYFEVYASMLNNKYGQILTSTSLETAIQSNSLNAIAKSFEFYKLMMNRYSIDGKTSARIYLKEKDFLVAHEDSLTDALNIFDSMAAIGSQEILVTFRGQLQEQIESERQILSSSNNLLKPLKDMAGPVILKEKLEVVAEKLGLVAPSFSSGIEKQKLPASSRRGGGSSSGDDGGGDGSGSVNDIDGWQTDADVVSRERKSSFSEDSEDTRLSSSFVIRSVVASDQNSSLESLIEVASSLYKQGKHNEALDRYFKAIRIIETSSDLDQDHENLEYSIVLCKIGNIHCIQRHYAAAREKYEKGIRIQKRILGSRHLMLANSLTGLAVVYLSEQQFKTSLDLLGEIMQIRESILGGNHPCVLDSLHNISIAYEKMATFYEAAEQYEDALGSLKSALCIIEALVGEDHYDKVAILNKMSSNYINLNRYGNALEAYRESLRISEIVLDSGAIYWDNFASFFDIKQASSSTDGKTQEVEIIELLNDALDTKAALLGREHAYVAFILGNIAKAYEDQGMYAKATDYYSQCLVIEKAVFGNQHLSIAEIYADLGIVSNLSGNLPAALQLMNEALAIKAAILSRDHIDYKEFHTLKHNIVNSTKPRKGMASTKKRRVKKVYISVDNSLIKWTQNRITVCEDKLKEGFKGTKSQTQKPSDNEDNCTIM